MLWYHYGFLVSHQIIAEFLGELWC